MRKNSGASLIELVLYIGIFTSTILLITFSTIQLSRLYIRVKNERRLAVAAESVLERMVREVRLARGVTSFNNNPTSLVLDTYADHALTPLAGGKTFSTSTNPVQINIIEGATTRALTSSDVFVRRLMFTQVSTAALRGVRIDLVLQSGVGSNVKTRTYHAFAMLRQSYTQ